jgi:hypothetical protein
MTKQEIHRRALLAAAKIALVTAGCSGAEGSATLAATQPAPTESRPDAPTATTPAATTTATAPTATAPTAPPVASTTATATPTTTATATPTTTPTATATTTPTTTPTAAQPWCHLPVYALPTEDDERCCEGEIGAILGEGFAFPAGALSAELVSCCSLVVSFLDEHQGAQGQGGHEVSWNERGACCAVLDPMPIGPTCTPWGPPSPPAMPAGWV